MASQNTGEQSWKILEQIFVDNDSLTGMQMPNVQYVSPDAVVGAGAAITYNYPSDIAPSGGNNGDVWYNPVADELFKKISGAWVKLTNRVLNPDYVAPVTNTTDCPIPVSS